MRLYYKLLDQFDDQHYVAAVNQYNVVEYINVDPPTNVVDEQPTKHLDFIDNDYNPTGNYNISAFFDDYDSSGRERRVG